MITIQMSLLLQKNIYASFCNILQAFMQDTIHQGFFIVLAVWILNDCTQPIKWFLWKPEITKRDLAKAICHKEQHSPLLGS